MAINGRQDEFIFNDFIDVAHNMEIKKAEEIIDVILSVVSRWPEFAKEANVSPEGISYVGGMHLNEQSLDEGLSVR